MDIQPTDIVCAVDLGGTNLRAAKIDREGRIHERARYPSPRDGAAEEVVERITAAVRACDGEEATRFASGCVVVPGTVCIETGTVITMPNLKSLEGFALGSALEKSLGRSVQVENDTNAAALGEMWQGAARGCKSIICLTLGTGVGSGIILDGKLWRGVDGTAGEIGHTSVEPFGGVKCKCGNTGCLEVYASATAVVRLTQVALLENRDSLLAAIPQDEITAEKVYEAGIAGDRLALAVYRSVGVHLGVVMASIANTFNPEMIVVGGGVAAAWELFAPYAEEQLKQRAFAVPARRCRVVRAQCGDDAGLLGAAWLGFGVR